MGDAFDDFDLDEVVGQQAQGPARRTFGRLGTGELGDAGLDLAGYVDFPGRLLAKLGDQCPMGPVSQQRWRRRSMLLELMPTIRQIAS